MTGIAPQDRAPAFLRAVRGLLRPLVKALIAQGVTAPALYALLKETYVEVAEKDFALDGARPTDSRISMLTGVHRRDVKSFRDQDRSSQVEAKEKATTIATLLARWAGDDEFTGADGAPIDLPRDGGADDDEPSFSTLVYSVSRDIRPRTVLDELLSQGLVVEVEGRLRLVSDAFVGPADQEQRVFFFGENVGDHLAAATDNLLQAEPRFLERAVFYNRLTPRSVDALEAQARALSADALQSLNQDALSLQAADADDADGTERFRYGVFFYRDGRDDEDQT